MGVTAGLGRATCPGGPTCSQGKHSPEQNSAFHDLFFSFHEEVARALSRPGIGPAVTGDVEATMNASSPADVGQKGVIVALSFPSWVGGATLGLGKAYPSPCVSFLVATTRAHERHVDSPIWAGSCSRGARWAVWYAQVVQASPAIAWAVPHEAKKVDLS